MSSSNHVGEGSQETVIFAHTSLPSFDLEVMSSKLQMQGNKRHEHWICPLFYALIVEYIIIFLD